MVFSLESFWAGDKAAALTSAAHRAGAFHPGPSAADSRDMDGAAKARFQQ